MKKRALALVSSLFAGTLFGAVVYFSATVSTSLPTPDIVKSAIAMWCFQNSRDFNYCEIGEVIGHTQETPDMYGMYAVTIHTDYGDAILKVYIENGLVVGVK